MTVPYPQWWLFPSELTDEECERIKAMAFEHGTEEPATTFGGAPSLRKTNVRWLNDDAEFGWLHTRIRDIAYRANQHIGLHLTHLPSLQFTQYDEPGSHYHWHQDVNYNDQRDTHRKLSIVCQLSDPDEYTGGEFKFKYAENPDHDTMMRKGTVICFVSYHEHMVEPIQDGKRYSLVGWYEGPRWS